MADTPSLPGLNRVLMPGEPELATRARRLVEGVPLADQTWGELVAFAAEFGVPAL